MNGREGWGFWEIMGVAMIVVIAGGFLWKALPFDNAEYESKEGAADVGKTIESRGTAYQVTRAYSDDLGQDGSGIYLVVQLTLTNTKDETATLLAGKFGLRGGNDKEYDAADLSGVDLDDKIVFSQDLEPDLPVEVATAFLVPEAAIPGASLIVDDRSVDLGLR